MRRRVLTACLVLDGLCALAAPLLLPALGAPDRYVDVGGLCVQEGVRLDGVVGGRPVDGSFCM